MNGVNSSCKVRKPEHSGVFRHTLLSLAIACCFGVGHVSGQPQGPQVVSGQASFVTQGNSLTISNSPNAIINWQGFSIGANELTRFNQQSAASAVLNRVVGADNSAILGALQSNGQVYLINPNGIFIGPHARIDVAGLVAGTLDLSNQDFLAGRYNFQAGVKSGNLVNQGGITTPEGGRIYLIAPNIENSGILTSPKGDITLAAGRSVQLVDSANPHLQVVVSAPQDQVLNLGQILAQSGKIGIYGALINHKGKLSADSAVVGENGKIVLKASRDALVEGNISATGAGQGGEIQVLGERVGILDGAKLDAGGQSGGGTILVGGDYQGKNPLVQNAQRTYVGAQAEIQADAQQGDGGKIIVWSNEATRVYGSLSAKGGKGGFIETSGHYLDVAGIKVDTGKGGTWLLDPTNLTVDTTLAASIKDTLDGGGNVALDTSASGPDEGNITVNAAISKTAGGDANLTFTADHNIDINAPITSTAGKLNVTLTADGASSWQSPGTIYIRDGATIVSNGGNISLTAGGFSFTSNPLDGFLMDGGAGTISLASTQNRGFGLGGVEVADIIISGGSLHQIKAANLAINAGNGSISVDSIDEAASGNIGTVTLEAGSEGNWMQQTPSFSVTFNNSSTFKALTVNAKNAIVINGNITTTVGDMRFDANTDYVSAGQQGLTWYDDIGIYGGSSLVAAGQLVFGQAGHAGSYVYIGPHYNAFMVTLPEGDVTLRGGQGVTFHGGFGHFGSSVHTGTIDAGSGALQFTKTVDSHDNTLVLKGQSVTQDNDWGIKTPHLSLDIGGNVTLNSTHNQISLVEGTLGGNLDIKTASTLSVGELGLTSSGGDIKLVANSISQQGPISAGTLDVSSGATSAGAIQLNNDNEVTYLKVSQPDSDGFGISFNGYSSYTVLSATNSATSTNGGVTLTASSGKSIAIAGPVTLNAAGAEVFLGVNNDPQGPYGGVTCSGSCLISANNISLDTMRGTTGTSGAPLKTQSISGGDTSLRLGNSDFPYGELHVQHSGNLTLTSDHLNPTDVDVAVSASGNLTVSNKVRAGSGDLTLAAGGTLTLPAYSTLEGANITLAAHAMNIDASQSPATIDATGGEVWFKPYALDGTVGVNLITNKPGAQNTLELTPGEVAGVSADKIRIGSTLAGNLNIEDTISFSGTVILESGGNITQGSNGSIATTNLGIRALGNVDLTSASSMVTNLAADIGDATHLNKNFSFKHAGDLNIGYGIDGMNGIRIRNDGQDYSAASPNGVITLDNGLGGVITQSGLGFLDAKALSASGAKILLDSYRNQVTAIAGLARSDESSGTVFSYSAQVPIRLATVGSLSGIRVIDSDGYQNSGDIVLNSILPANRIASGTPGITQDSGASLNTGGGLSVSSDGAITLSNLDNSVAKLAADLKVYGAGSGSLYYRNDGALAVDTVNGLDGIVSNNADIKVVALGGNLTLNQNVNAGNGSVTLSATGDNSLLTIGSGVAVTGKAAAPNAGVMLFADRMDLQGSIDATGTGVLLDSNSANRLVKIGAADTDELTASSGTLGLSNVELGKVTANTLIIGNTTNGGSIEVKDSFSWIGSGLLQLWSAGDITTATGRTVSANTLELLAGGGIDARIAGTYVSAKTSGVAAPISLTKITGNLTTKATANSSGIVSNGGNITLTTGEGGIILNSPIDAGSGDVTLNAAGSIANQGDVSSADLKTFVVSGKRTTFSAVGGIGSTDTLFGGALKTHAVELAASNTDSGDIVILNNSPNATPAFSADTLTLYGVDNTASGGKVKVENYGELNTGAVEVKSASDLGLKANSPLVIGTGGVTATTGAISLTAGSGAGSNNNLTINGNVNAVGGGVTLSAYNNVTIASGTSVQAGGAGGITATATTGSIAATGATLAAPNATAPIALTAGTTVSGAPAGAAVTQNTSGTANTTTTTTPTTTTTTTTTPTLSQCTTNPALTGCSGVLPTLAQCTATPTAAGCSAVLPSTSQCSTNPNLAGCSAVLPTLNQCTSNPNLAGCNTVLPNTSQCSTNPNLAGCSAVLPSVGQCSDNPALSGCGAVLPSLSQCTANPALAGCNAVLPSISQCTANATLAGCSVILPTLNQCTSNPNLSGCGSILPSLSQCTVNPGLSGCAAVLPSLSQCSANPGLAGCASVLPSVSQCAANPAQAGCGSVLPTLSQCIANPAQAGCSSILPTLAQCAANPAQAGCSAVLPSTSQCSANPALTGCTSVLPSLAQCASNPALTGCSSVLPTLAQCTANPSQTGCGAVLPSTSQCSANPGLSGCATVLPSLAQCTANPALAGCTAVLPSASQCAANPGQSGCAPSTPSAGQCAANPSLAGCAPSQPPANPDPCLANPSQTGCNTPPSSPSTVESKPLEQAINQTNNSVNNSVPQSVNRQSGNATTPPDGSGAGAANARQQNQTPLAGADGGATQSGDKKDDKKETAKNDESRKDGVAKPDERKTDAPAKKPVC